MKIGVFLPNWIGDAVMATPALRAVRTEFSEAEIVAIGRPYVADVLSGLDLAQRMIFWHPGGADPHQRGWRLVLRLRRERFDLALLLPNSLRSAWMAWLSGALVRAGFDRDGRRLFLTDSISPRSTKVPNPVLDEYLRLAELIGCQKLSRAMELATVDEDDWQWNAFWTKQKPALPNAGIICLNPGGAFGAAKHWPAESFGRLAERLATNCGKTIVVLCGPSERDEARRIVAFAHHPSVVSLADMPSSIGLTKAAVKHSELLITTDSGPRHFAPPFGVPVVTLFGPTHIAWSETYYPQAIHLQEQVDCGPCQKRVCPLEHHKCMRDLSVEKVYNAAVKLLERRQRKAA